MDRSDSIRDRFGPAAAAYAQSAVHGGPDLDAMLAAGELEGRERVLDVGCGPGHTALAFARRVAEVVALDLTAPMLEQAQRLADERGLRNVRFERGDAAALPCGSDAFDVVTSRLSAHHYARPDAAVLRTDAGSLIRRPQARAPRLPSSAARREIEIERFLEGELHSFKPEVADRAQVPNSLIGKA